MYLLNLFEYDCVGIHVVEVVERRERVLCARPVHRQRSVRVKHRVLRLRLVVNRIQTSHLGAEIRSMLLRRLTSRVGKAVANQAERIQFSARDVGKGTDHEIFAS